MRYRKIFFDRREYERMPSRFPSAIEWDQFNAEGTVVEISMAGCSIQTDAELAPGSIVRLRLNVFGDERSVLVDAAVVRSSYPKRPGVEFLTIERREKEK
ncbi:MAG: PilZ domain-containing protein, partial [Candidatus Binatia bacterium]